MGDNWGLNEGVMGTYPEWDIAWPLSATASTTSEFSPSDELEEESEDTWRSDMSRRE